jgi:hypothetical protein
MGIPGIEFDGIKGQKFDNGFEIEPGMGIALDVSYPDMQVWQGDLRKLTLLRLDLFL